MAHTVSFHNCENNWMNALPLGNGCFGAMAFFEDGVLSLSMNHYESYYYHNAEALPEAQLAHTPERSDPGLVHTLTRKRADLNQPPEGESFYSFRLSRNKPQYYCDGTMSESYPTTGELKFLFADSLKGGESYLSLCVEDARVDFSLSKGNHHLALEIIVTRRDCILIQVKQNEGGLLHGVRIWNPPYRDQQHPDIRYEQPDTKTVSYTVDSIVPSSYHEPKPFRFSGIVRLKNAECDMTPVEYGVTANLCAQTEKFEILAGVFTDWRYEKLPNYSLMDELEATAALRAEHAAYWKKFYSKANICLPDKFLEKIWYVNQYALDCSSGRDGIMKHHACGLNGLWDIRHPNLWGSMWYWDVNIQAAFAGVFSSNRLELGKVFSDGLKSYEKLAERFAHDLHNLPGTAIDYPHFAYYCMWPWCAQYLWAQYEYSKNVDYLRDEAYPLFLKLCRFVVSLFEWDSVRGCYIVYPDISPEQGPLAHNTVITIATVKYMLRFTLKAAEILGDYSELLSQIQKLLDGMPAYAMCDCTEFGTHFKDADDAPDRLWIRHPSMLMPVFPIGEIDMESDESLCRIAENTIDYLEENCEIGIFQGSWLSAAAARMGNGQKALRLLYERGIDHMLRSNGLAAEATDRFINFCLDKRQPLYYPCMMEFSGEMLAAVNEMLLQSQNHLIHVFPAIPDGNPEYNRLVRRGQGQEEYHDRFATYDAWNDIKFTNLLARGAFEVSAEMKNRYLEWVSIHSKVGGIVRITTPTGFNGYQVYSGECIVNAVYENNVLHFDTLPDHTYFIKATSEVCVSDIAPADDSGILQHLAYTKRRIFIGEDKETSYARAFDSFVRSWFVGNVRMDNQTAYKFDITQAKGKDYGKLMERQSYASEPGMCETGQAFKQVDLEPFSIFRGYGFEQVDKISIRKTNGPDMLREDFAESTEPGIFLLELPRGRYELLAISGSADAESLTCIQTENGYCIGGQVISAGSYQIETIPLTLQRDGITRLQLSSRSGYHWMLNALFLNLVKGYG